MIACEREAIAAAARGLSQQNEVVVAIALRIAALASLYRHGWRQARAKAAARLAFACRAFSAAISTAQQSANIAIVFERAKTYAARGALLENAFSSRSVRSTAAARTFFLRAEHDFTEAGAPMEAAMQRANLARCAFEIGVLGSTEAFDLAVSDYLKAEELAPPDMPSWRISLWRSFRGAALSALAEAGRSELFTEAERLMREALPELERSAPPLVRARLHLNLGGLLIQSRRVSWRQDIADGLDLLHAGRDLAADNDDIRAAIDYTLCAGYQLSASGVLAVNIERAIAFGERALDAPDPVLSPVDYVKAVQNLAEAYALRVIGDRRQSLEQARTLIDEAIRLTPERYAAKWSQLQGSAGRILLFHAKPGKVGDYRRAFQRFRLGLRALRGHNDFPGMSGTLHLNAALALLGLHEIREGNIALSLAAKQTELGLSAFSDANDLEGRRRAMVVSGEIAAIGQDWQTACGIFAKAITMAPKDSPRGAVDAFSRIARSDGSDSDMFAAAAYCHVRNENFAEALAMIEKAKARALSRVLSHRARQAAPPRAGEDIIAIAPIFHRTGTAVLIVSVSPESAHVIDVVMLPSVTKAVLIRKLFGDEQGALGWSQALHARDSATIATAIDGVFAWQWEHLVEPVERRLRAIFDVAEKQVVLMPQAGSGALPWHAAGPDPRTVGPLCQRWNLSYAPSISVLQYLPIGHGGPASLVSIADPATDLEMPSQECQAIADALAPAAHHHFGRRSSNVTALAARCADATHIHFAGHGAFDALDAGRAALRLSHGISLTADEISADFDLRAAPLVTLGACETGVVDFAERSDEFVGLPSAWLAAGARCVVASLWKVSDAASTAFFAEFYRRLGSRAERPGTAARAAADFVRTLTLERARIGGKGWAIEESEIEKAVKLSGNADRPFSHPFYWAPFAVFGRSW